MRPSPIYFCVGLLLLAGVCPAQSSSATDSLIFRFENSLLPIDKNGKEVNKPQSLRARMEALRVPGVSIAIFDKGRIVWAKGYGFADKTNGVPVDSATLFQAASLSKPLASVAMFALSERNVIAPDRDVNLQLTSWKVPASYLPTTEKVTPRRIVAHMAGFGTPGFKGYTQKERLPTLLQILDGLPPANSPAVRVVHTPGAMQSYSGGGYVLLQLLLQEKTGLSFGVLMDSLVLRPAGMAQSSFVVRPPDSLLPHIAIGYHANGKRVNDGFHIYPEQAAAGLWTTPSDYARFLLNVGNSLRENRGIFQQGTVQQMFSNEPAGNGSGFGIEGVDETQRFTHRGSNVGYHCYAAAFMNPGRGVVVMTNSDNGYPLIREIVRTIYREYGWR